MGALKDLTGMRFGKWTVESRNIDKQKGRGAYYNCVCDCGTRKTVSSNSLIRGRSTSCGCSWKHDLTGKRFCRLVAIERKSVDFEFKNGTHHKKIVYVCRCDCGNISEVESSRLIKGETTSCGCYHKELMSKIASTHGKSGTRLYNIWAGIIGRCTNKNIKSYKDYGARGISVCEEWEKFEPFMKWALSNGYSDSLTIDRKDVNKNYCPENCRWITKSEQANNTRRSIMIEFLGVKKCLKQWISYMGWTYSKYEMRHFRGNPIFDENEKTLIEEKLRSDSSVLQTDL